MSHDATDLAQQLASSDPTAARAAAEELMLLGEEAQPAAVALTKATGHADDETRAFAVSAVEELGQPATNDVDALVRLLTAEQSDTGYWAATLLGRLGEDAAEATAQLAATVADEQRALAVRERAAWALGRIGASASAAVATLETAAGSGDSRLARLAGEALEEISAG